MVGAKMIVHPLGQHVGTITGGLSEADVHPRRWM
ncbi:MAG: XdhC family protein [Dehalococcoidia bacterium]|nr:XdhC family protein [Dehalococcoidia bacterium]